MTTATSITPDEFGLSLILMDDIEHKTTVRGGLRHFDNRTPAHPPHRNVVGEIDNPRIVWRNQIALCARARKYRNLRFNGNVQSAQQALEITGDGRKGNLHRSVLQR